MTVTLKEKWVLKNRNNETNEKRKLKRSVGTEIGYDSVY
jgi:hypothetical protein